MSHKRGDKAVLENKDDLKITAIYMGNGLTELKVEKQDDMNRYVYLQKTKRDIRISVKSVVGWAVVIWLLTLWTFGLVFVLPVARGTKAGAIYWVITIIITVVCALLCFWLNKEFSDKKE